MKTKLLLAFFIGLLFVVLAPSRGDLSPDEAWIAVSLNQNGPDQPSVEYYGTIDRKILAGILSIPTPTGFVKLDHVAQMTDEGRIVPLSEMRFKDSKRGYSRVMYFRIENIVRVVELDDQFVKDNAFDLTEKK